jgi:hypothetical protein
VNNDYKLIFESYKQILNEKNKVKKLDSVGKEDSDVNNDGKVDSTDRYLIRRRLRISKELGKKVQKEQEAVKARQEEEEASIQKSDKAVKRAQVDIHNFLRKYNLKTDEIIFALQGVLQDYSNTGSGTTASTLGAGTEPVPTPGNPVTATTVGH